MRSVAVALIALAAGLWGPAALAQSSLDEVFDSLEQLQEANLGIARQMAELELRAAAELEAALAQGTIGLPAHQAIARTFIGNARTLAAIMLSPMQTYQNAAGESMFVLVRRNVELLKTITSYRAADPALDAAITRYTVLQMQTQDMAQALQNGWTRYADVLGAAERAGLLADNTFDPETQSWALGTPVPGGTPTGVAVLAPTASLAPTPGTSPPAAPQSGADAADEAPVTPAAPDLASTVKPLEVPSLVPAPTTTLAQVPRIEDLTAPPAQEERLAAQGPLDLAVNAQGAATAEPVPPEPAAPETPPTAVATTAQMGDWLVVTNAEGELVATASNLIGDTRTAISSLSMACAPDGSVAYAINGSGEFPAFRVYADRSQNITVTARSNVVLGADADAMAETLAAAVSWAQQVPDSGRGLSLRTADAAGTLALFSPNGYIDARAALVSGCGRPGALPLAEAEPEAPAPEKEPARGSEEPAAEPAPVAAEEPAEPGAGPTPPVPRPRLDRSNIHQPVSLM